MSLSRGKAATGLPVPNFLPRAAFLAGLEAGEAEAGEIRGSLLGNPP